VLTTCSHRVPSECKLIQEPEVTAISGCGFNEFDNFAKLDSTLVLRYGIKLNSVPVSTECKSFQLDSGINNITLTVTDRKKGSYYHSPCSDAIEINDLPESPVYNAISGKLNLWMVPYRLTKRSNYEIRYRLWGSLQNVVFKSYMGDSILIESLVVGIDELDYLKKLDKYSYASFPVIEPLNLDQVKKNIKSRYPEGNYFFLRGRINENGTPERISASVRPNNEEFKKVVMEELQNLKYPKRKSFEFPKTFIEDRVVFLNVQK